MKYHTKASTVRLRTDRPQDYIEELLANLKRAWKHKEEIQPPSLLSDIGDVSTDDGSGHLSCPYRKCARKLKTKFNLVRHYAQRTTLNEKKESSRLT